MYPFPTLPPRLSREIFAALRQALPNPTEDTQDAIDARDMIAMAAVAALNPIDAAEAMLAVQVVSTEAHARDSLRLSNLPNTDLPTILRCRAQAASMMRQMQQALRALHRMQAMRPREEPAQPDLTPQVDASQVGAPLADPPAVVSPPHAARHAPAVQHPDPRPRHPDAPPSPYPHPSELGMPRFAWAWVRPGTRQTSH
jgi:hypothetical protein